MLRVARLPIFLGLLALSSLSSTAGTIAPSQLPAAVSTALKQKFPSARVEAAEQDDHRNDYVYYRITIAEAKNRTLVTVTETGEIVAIAPLE
jgi:hypothetical protein